VAGLLIANAVGATVTVWTEPAGDVVPKVVLTMLAGLAVATLGVAAMSPRSRLGRRLVMLGDLLAAASLPAYFAGILVQQTRGADGAAAASAFGSTPSRSSSSPSSGAYSSHSASSPHHGVASSAGRPRRAPTTRRPRRRDRGDLRQSRASAAPH